MWSLHLAGDSFFSPNTSNRYVYLQSYSSWRCGYRHYSYTGCRYRRQSKLWTSRYGIYKFKRMVSLQTDFQVHLWGWLQRLIYCSLGISVWFQEMFKYLSALFWHDQLLERQPKELKMVQSRSICPFERVCFWKSFLVTPFHVFLLQTRVSLTFFANVIAILPYMIANILS